MKILFVNAHGASSHTHNTGDVLLLGVTSPLDQHRDFRMLDGICAGGLQTQADMEEFTGAAGKTLVRHLNRVNTSCVIVFGLGSKLDEIRSALADVFQKAKKLKAKTVILAPVGKDDDDFIAIGELIGEAAEVANHNPKTYKTEHSGYKAPTQFDVVKVVASRHHQIALSTGIKKGRIIGGAINAACDLAGEPANIMTPTAFRDLALAIAGQTETEGTIEANAFDDNALAAMGANGILMVARGSAERPWLIELVYHPKGGPTEKSLALVGKTVTFDTGGNDIKTGGGMRDMKRDKTGGADVLSAFQAIAALNVPMTVKAYLPATENMIGERAMRAGDVFTTMSGRTVEVGNTDAEGRLILVEAITLAQQNGATYIVDVATLTGAAKGVAGDVAPLAFGNDAEFSALVVRAAQEACEQIALQEMLPGVKSYNDSAIADICNIPAPKGAGSMAAAWFLAAWVKEGVKWLHLDIANVAWKNDRATGHIVRTLIKLARIMSADS